MSNAVEGKNLKILITDFIENSIYIRSLCVQMNVVNFKAYGLFLWTEFTYPKVTCLYWDAD